MARAIRISCVLPLGVKIESVTGHSLGELGAMIFGRNGPLLPDLGTVTKKLSSNQRITLVLDIPVGAEIETMEALRELIRDLEP